MFFVDARSLASELSTGEKSRIASTNVIFELGFMAGAWGRDRTLIVHRRSHGPDKFGDIDGVTKFSYDRSITECIPRIASALRRLGPRPDDRRDIGVLVRMLNVCTFQPSALRVSATRYVNHRGEEGIQHASDLVEYIVDTMSDFVTPRIPAMTGMRVYYSVYLGDGVVSPKGNDQYYYVGTGLEDEDMKFVIGFSNEDDPSRRFQQTYSGAMVEQHWLLGKPISVRGSNTATVFKTQKSRQATQGQSNYSHTPGEFGVVTIPVVWHGSGDLRVSLGVLAISIRDRSGIGQPVIEDLRDRLQIVSHALASAFDLIMRHHDDGSAEHADDRDEAEKSDGRQPDELGDNGDNGEVFGAAWSGDVNRRELATAIWARRAFGAAVINRLVQHEKLKEEAGKLIYVGNDVEP